MKYTKEEVINKITEQLNDCLPTYNVEIYRWEDKIVNVNLEEQSVTLKFNYHIVEEDTYLLVLYPLRIEKEKTC